MAALPRRHTALRRKDTIARLRRVCAPETLRLLRFLGSQAEGLHVRAYVVGGFVRDLLLKRRNLDIDVVLEPDGISFARKIASQLAARCIEYPQFKTAKLELANGRIIDIATCRSEVYPHPAALPVVRADTIRRDLERRDFTINTLALVLNPHRFGEILDYCDAVSDVRQSRIRVLHERSFVDDPTRVFRAIRFEQRLHFKIEPHTGRLMRDAAAGGMLSRLQPYRVAEELKLMLEEPDPVRNIRRLSRFHGLAVIHPALLRYDRRLAMLLQTAEKAVRWYGRTFPERELKRWLVYVLALRDGVAGKPSSRLFRHLEGKKHVRRCLTAVTQEAPRIMRLLQFPAKTHVSRIHGLLAEMPAEAVLYVLAKLPRSAGKEIIITFLTKNMIR